MDSGLNYCLKQTKVIRYQVKKIEGGEGQILGMKSSAGANRGVLVLKLDCMKKCTYVLGRVLKPDCT